MRWTLLLLWLLFPSLAFGNTTLAIAYFDSSTKNEELEALKVGLAQMLITDVLNADGLTVVERSKLQNIMDELDLGHTGVADPASAAKIGKMLGARYMMFGSYLELFGTLRIDARIVDVETSQIVAAQQAQGTAKEFMRMEQELAGFARETMGKLASATQTPTPTPGGTANEVAPQPAPVRNTPAPAPAPKPAPTRQAPAQATPEMYEPDPKALEAAQAYSEGLIFMDAGDGPKARERFEAALASKPNLAHAKTALADLEI